MLSRFGVCVSLKEHMQSTSGESERAFWLEKKRLLIEQQCMVRDKHYMCKKSAIVLNSIQFNFLGKTRY